MRKIKSCVGESYGRLTVIADIPIAAPGSRRKVLVQCSCGTKVESRLDALRNGSTVSCGCKKAEHNLKHGHRREGSQDMTYISWYSMIGRCTNPSNPAYKHYGARGIKVDERWTVFEAFLSDMGQRPPGTTLERQDNDQEYGPGNCVWATLTEQAWNKRNTKRVQYQGRELTVRDVAQMSGQSEQKVRYRLSKGWSVDEIVNNERKALQ